MIDNTDGLNLRETIARIDRKIAEAAKCRAADLKLSVEAARKYRRQRLMMPVLTLAATLVAIAALTPAIERALGGQG